MSAASSALSTQEQLHVASLENKKAGRLVTSDQAGDLPPIDKKGQKKKLADDDEVEVVEHHT